MHCMKLVRSLGSYLQPFPLRTVSTTPHLQRTLQVPSLLTPRSIGNPLTSSNQHNYSGIVTRRPLSILASHARQNLVGITYPNNLCSNHGIINLTPPQRSVIHFSYNKGKRKTVKTVLKRFFRLHWGIWIRTKAGRHKKLWKKNSARRKRARQHVFCNATQSYMLDKMVGRFWRKETYYVDDPYESYHERDNFWITKR